MSAAMAAATAATKKLDAVRDIVADLLSANGTATGTGSGTSATTSSSISGSASAHDARLADRFVSIAEQSADHDHGTFTREMLGSATGNLSHFNSKNQIKLSLVLHLQSLLKGLTDPTLYDPNRMETDDRVVERSLPAPVLTGLCANFDMLATLCEKRPEVCSEALRVLLKSLGSLPLNALREEPHEPVDKLEKLLTTLLMAFTDDTKKDTISSVFDPAQLLATLINLGLTRASIVRIFSILNTLITVHKHSTRVPATSGGAQTRAPAQLSMPAAVQTLMDMTRPSGLHAPAPELIVNEFTVKGGEYKWSSAPPAAAAAATPPSGSIASDGDYLYIHSSNGLLKVGTGSNGTEAGKVYASNPSFFAGAVSSMAIVADRLYFRSPAVSAAATSSGGGAGIAFHVINRATLESAGTITGSGTGSIPTANNSLRKSFVDGSAPIVAMRNHLAVISMAAAATTGAGEDAVSIDYYEPPTLRFVRSVGLTGPRRMIDNESVGGLFAAGGNENGQYGDGTHVTAMAPVNIKFFHDKPTIRCIAMSNGCSVFVLESGEVYVVGANHRGQLGSGTQTPIPTPTLLEEFKVRNKTIVYATCGPQSEHVIFLTDDGEAWVSGGNASGQCGLGDTRDFVLKPKRIDALVGHRIVHAACELRSSAFVTDAGLLFTCGEGSQGEIGHGVTTATIRIPKLVPSLPAKVTMIAMSYQHMLILLADGQVMVCGQNTYGQCGFGAQQYVHTPTSLPIFQRERVKKVSTGYYHSGVVTRDNKSYMFGYGDHGALGLGNDYPRLRNEPALLKTPAAVTDIVCGYTFTMWIDTNGAVWASGTNAHGQLHLPRANAIHSSTKIEQFEEFTTTVVAGGYNNSFIYAENCEGALSADAYRKAVFYSSSTHLAALIPPHVPLSPLPPAAADKKSKSAPATASSAAIPLPAVFVGDAKSDKSDKSADDKKSDARSTTVALASSSGDEKKSIAAASVPVAATASADKRPVSSSHVSRVFVRPTPSATSLLFVNDLTLPVAHPAGSIVICFCPLTNAMWTLRLDTGLVTHHLNVSPSAAASGVASPPIAHASAKSMLAFPHTSEAVFSHPNFVLPAVGTLVPVTRIVVGMLSALELLSRRYDRSPNRPPPPVGSNAKPDPQFRALCVGRDAATFRAIETFMRTAWNSYAIDKSSAEWTEFFGVCLPPTLRLLRLNLAKLTPESDQSLTLTVNTLSSDAANKLVSVSVSDGAELSQRVASWLNVGVNDLIGVMSRNGRRLAVRVIHIAEDDWQQQQFLTAHERDGSVSSDRIGLSANTLRNLNAQSGDVVNCEFVGMPLLSEVTLCPVADTITEIEAKLKVDYSDVKLPAADAEADAKLSEAAREAKLADLKRKKLYDSIATGVLKPYFDHMKSDDKSHWLPVMEHGLFAIPYRATPLPTPPPSPLPPPDMFVQFKLLKALPLMCGCGVLSRNTKYKLDASAAPVTRDQHLIDIKTAPIDELSKQSLALFDTRDLLESIITESGAFIASAPPAAPAANPSPVLLAMRIINGDAIACYNAGYQWFYPSWSERIRHFHRIITRYNQLTSSLSASTAVDSKVERSEREGLHSLLATVIGILAATHDISRLFFPRITEEQMNLYGRVHVRPALSRKFNLTRSLEYVRTHKLASQVLSAADVVDLGEVWSSMDGSGDGAVLIEEFKAYLSDAFTDSDLNSLFYAFFKLQNQSAASAQPDATAAVDFFDFVNFSLMRQNMRKAVPSAKPLQLTKPDWALPVTAVSVTSAESKTGAASSRHLFEWHNEIMVSIMPSTAIKALRSLLEFVESHTDQNLLRLSAAVDAAPAPTIDAASPIQESAIALLIALQNDLVRRALKLQSEDSVQQSKARFPPLSLFCSLVFEKSLDVCERVARLLAVAPAAGTVRGNQPKTVAIFDALSKSPLLRSVVPFMISNLTTLITTGRDWIEELGKQVIALLKCLDTIGSTAAIASTASASPSATAAAAASLVLSPSKSDATARLVDGKEVVTDDASREVVSTVIETPHPYADATRKTYNLSFPNKVTVLVLEFDSDEDFVQVIVQTKSVVKGKEVIAHTRMFQQFSGSDRSGWPPAALIVPGNRVSFDFQTASDYNEKKDVKNRWGFRCVIKGYVDSQTALAGTATASDASNSLAATRLWLNVLESQLGSFGAVCAGNLIAGGEATAQITDPAGDYERKNGALFNEKPFTRGFAVQYLSPEHASEFKPRTAEERFLADLMEEDPCDDSVAPAAAAERSDAHTLVHWMRKHNGGVEPAESWVRIDDAAAAAAAATARPAAAPEIIALAGIPSKFTVLTCDEFKASVVPAANTKLELSVHAGWSVACSDDFSGELEIIDNPVPVPHKVEQGTAVASLDGTFVLIMGGQSARNAEQRAVHKYNVATNSYTKVADLPFPMRGAHGGVLPDGRLFATGTYPQDNLYIYDPVTNRWVTKPNRIATGWQARSAVDSNGRIHITGGLNGRNSYSIYDPKTDAWERATPLLQGIMCHGMAIEPNGRVWVFGGADTVNNSAQKTMYFLEPGTKTWKAGPNLPSVLVCFGYAYDASQIVVCGGSTAYSNMQEPTFDLIWVFSFARREWTVHKQKLPAKSRSSCCVLVGGTIHSFTGSRDRQPHGSHYEIRAITPAAVTNTSQVTAARSNAPKVDQFYSPAEITNNNDGTYSCQLNLLKSGVYYVDIKLNGHPIKNSPLKVQVTSPFLPFTVLPPQSDSAAGSGVVRREKTVDDPFFDLFARATDEHYGVYHAVHAWTTKRVLLDSMASTTLLSHVQKSSADTASTAAATNTPTAAAATAAADKKGQAADAAAVGKEKEKEAGKMEAAKEKPAAAAADEKAAADATATDKPAAAAAEDSKSATNKAESKATSVLNTPAAGAYDLCTVNLTSLQAKRFKLANGDRCLASNYAKDKFQAVSINVLSALPTGMVEDEIKIGACFVSERLLTRLGVRTRDKRDPKLDKEKSEDDLEQERYVLLLRPKGSFPVVHSIDLQYINRSKSATPTPAPELSASQRSALIEHIRSYTRPFTEDDVLPPLTWKQTDATGPAASAALEFRVTALRARDSYRQFYGSATAETSVNLLFGAEPDPVTPVAAFTDRDKKDYFALDADVKSAMPKPAATASGGGAKPRTDFPEWYLNLRMIQPGMPPKLYAMAWKKNDKKMELAVNWLMDAGVQYLQEHKKDFDEDDKKNAVPWECPFCTLKNRATDFRCSACNSEKAVEVPTYLDPKHEFWELKDDIKTPKTDKVTLLFGGDKFEDVVKPPAEQVLSLPSLPGVISLPPPPQTSPSANSPAARRVVRMMFAALLKHHALIDEAVLCAEYLVERIDELRAESAAAAAVDFTSIRSPVLLSLSDVWGTACEMKKWLSAQHDARGAQIKADTEKHKLTKIKLEKANAAAAIEKEKAAKEKAEKAEAAKDAKDAKEVLKDRKDEKDGKSKDAEKPAAAAAGAKEQEKSKDSELVTPKASAASDKKDEKSTAVAATTATTTAAAASGADEKSLAAAAAAAASVSSLSIVIPPLRRQETSVVLLVKCSKGHPMTAGKELGPNRRPPTYGGSNYNCDICPTKSLPFGPDFYHCLLCGTYDACPECVSKVGVYVKVTVAAAAAAAAAAKEEEEDVYEPFAAEVCARGVLLFQLQTNAANRPTALSRRVAAGASANASTSAGTGRRLSFDDNNGSSDKAVIGLVPTANGGGGGGDSKRSPPVSPEKKPRSAASNASGAPAGMPTMQRSWSTKVERKAAPTPTASTDSASNGGSSLLTPDRKAGAAPLIRTLSTGTKADAGAGSGTGARRSSAGFDSQLSRVPSNIKSHETSVAILKFLQNDKNNPTLIRHALTRRRTRGRYRARGLLLMLNLIQSTTAMSLKHDYIWVLSTAIKRCSVPTLVPDEKDPKKLVPTNEEVHYRQGLAGAGPGTMQLVRKSFRALYITMARLLRSVTAAARVTSGGGANRSNNRVAADMQWVLLDAWALDFRTGDQRFLMDSQVFPLIRRIMAGPEADDDDSAVDSSEKKADPALLPASTAAASIDTSPSQPSAPSQPSQPSVTAKKASDDACLIWTPRDITRRVTITATSGQARIGALTDGKTDTYWQSNANDAVPDYERAPKSHTLELEFPRVRYRSDPTQTIQYMPVSEVVWHIDGERDADTQPRSIVISAGDNRDALEVIHKLELPKETGWYTFSVDAMRSVQARTVRPDPITGTLRVRHLHFKIVSCYGVGHETRIRALKVYSPGRPQPLVIESAHTLEERLQFKALDVFRALVGRCFFAGGFGAGNKAAAAAAAADSDAANAAAAAAAATAAAVANAAAGGDGDDDDADDEKADAKAEAKAEAKAGAKADAKADAKAAAADVKGMDVKAAAADVKADAKAEAKADVKADAKTDGKADAQADAKAGGDAKDVPSAEQPKSEEKSVPPPIFRRQETVDLPLQPVVNANGSTGRAEFNDLQRLLCELIFSEIARESQRLQRTKKVLTFITETDVNQSGTRLPGDPAIAAVDGAGAGDAAGAAVAVAAVVDPLDADEEILPPLAPAVKQPADIKAEEAKKEAEAKAAVAAAANARVVRRQAGVDRAGAFMQGGEDVRLAPRAAANAERRAGRRIVRGGDEKAALAKAKEKEKEADQQKEKVREHEKDEKQKQIAAFLKQNEPPALPVAAAAPLGLGVGIVAADKKPGDEKAATPLAASDEKQKKPATAVDPNSFVSDVYLYELVSMVASLSVSEIGQRFVSNPNFVNTLLSLLVPGTPRIQRSLLRILKRVLPAISPDRLNLTGLFTDSSQRVYRHPVDLLLFCVASALAVSVRDAAALSKHAKSTELVGWLRPFAPSEAMYCVSLLRSLWAPSATSQPNRWSASINRAVTTALGKVAHVSAAQAEDPQHTDFWLALAALSFISGAEGETPLVKEFEPKAPTPVATPAPGTVVPPSIESLTSLQSYDGICRLKLLNPDGSARTLLTTDLAHCKAMAEFRKASSGAACRFCAVSLTAKNRAKELEPAIDALSNVCNSESCVTARDTSCVKTLACGHFCCGVKGETKCLACLNPACAKKNGTKQDADSMCNICYSDNLCAMPSIELTCGHFFHADCARRQLKTRWPGARVTFGFRGCSLCKADMRHPALNDLTAPIDFLYEDVKKKSLMRLKFENLERHHDIVTKGARFYNDPLGFAIHKFAYYLCFKCQKPYFGGDYACAAAGPQQFDPSELICGACSPIAAEECPTHGRDYLEFKCRFCCSVAIWFCFGTTHFCEPCHRNNGTLCSMKKEAHVQCPCKPKDNDSMPQKLESGAACPLGVKHPPSGEEFALGCGLCKNIKDF